MIKKTLIISLIFLFLFVNFSYAGVYRLAVSFDYSCVSSGSCYSEKTYDLGKKNWASSARLKELENTLPFKIVPVFRQNVGKFSSDLFLFIVDKHIDFDLQSLFGFYQVKNYSNNVSYEDVRICLSKFDIDHVYNQLSTREKMSAPKLKFIEGAIWIKDDIKNHIYMRNYYIPYFLGLFRFSNFHVMLTDYKTKKSENTEYGLDSKL